MALREVLAELDMQVRGLAKVDEANVAIDRYVRSTQPAASETEKLRVSQQEAFETARRLASRIRSLQKAEGDHSRQILELRVAMARAKDAAKDYGRQIDELTASEKKASRAADKGDGQPGLMASMKGAGAAIAGVAAAATAAIGSFRIFTNTIEEVVQKGVELDQISQAIGLSTGALQEWQFIAERAGIETRDLRQGFGDLADAADQNDDALRKLGVQTRDQGGGLKSLDVLMEETLVAMHGMENQTERLAVAQRIFGEDAGSSFAVLADMAPTIDDLKERVRELGGGMSKNAIKRSVEAGDAMQEWRLAMTSLKSTLAADLLPPLTRAIRSIAEVGGKIAEVIRQSSAMDVVVETMKVLGITLAAIAAPALLAVGVLAGLFLVVEDIVTAFRGGESIFGSWVEGLAEAMGISLTFTGILEGIGVGWDIMKAKAMDAIASIVEGAASLEESLGIDVLGGLGETAKQIRAGADVAQREASDDARGLVERDLRRRQQRAVLQVRRQTAAAAQANIDARSEVNINGASDPEAVRQVVREENDRRVRQLADLIPEVAGAG